MNTDPSRAMQRWRQSVLSHIDFLLRGGDRGRKDENFDWMWFRKRPTAHFVDARRRVRGLVGRIGGTLPKGYSVQWLEQNAEMLWKTRETLADDLSRRQFDDALVLKVVGYRRAFFPVEAFDSYLDVHGSRPFAHPKLPDMYIGLPLHVLDVERGERASLIAADGFVEGVDRYRQYFVERGGVTLAPREGETVLDCGACIGDVATVFAMHVGDSGQVHMFDPMPAHAAFCRLQMELNPHMAGRMHVVPMAVGATSNGLPPIAETSVNIRPDAIPDNSFPFVSIDDYVKNTGIRVDVIKMDIEGGEGGAIQGAAETITRFRPRLMVSAYHRTDDLWTLREHIQKLCPAYRFHFGHHTPVQWESVLYAV